MGGFFSRLFSRKKKDEAPQSEEDGYSQAEMLGVTSLLCPT